MVLALLVGLLLTTLVIRITGTLTPSFEVDDGGSALIAAAVMTVVRWLFASPVAFLESTMTTALFGPIESELTSGWRYQPFFHYGVAFLWTTLLLWVAALVTPNIRIRGVLGVLLAAAVLTAVDAFAPTLLSQIGLNA